MTTDSSSGLLYEPDERVPLALRSGLGLEDDRYVVERFQAMRREAASR